MVSVGLVVTAYSTNHKSGAVPSLPSWSRSKWWTVFSRQAFQVLCRAPRGTLLALLRSLLLPLRYKVMTSLCGPLVGSSSRGGSTRVPFYLVGDVVGV